MALPEPIISTFGIGRDPEIGPGIPIIKNGIVESWSRILVGWRHQDDTPEGRAHGKLWAWVAGGRFQVYDENYNRSPIPGDVRFCGHANFTMIRMFHPYFAHRGQPPRDMDKEDKEMCRERYWSLMRRHQPDRVTGTQLRGAQDETGSRRAWRLNSGINRGPRSFTQPRHQRPLPLHTGWWDYEDILGESTEEEEMGGSDTDDDDLDDFKELDDLDELRIGASSQHIKLETQLLTSTAISRRHNEQRSSAGGIRGIKHEAEASLVQLSNTDIPATSAVDSYAPARPFHPGTYESVRASPATTMSSGAYQMFVDAMRAPSEDLDKNAQTFGHQDNMNIEFDSMLEEYNSTAQNELQLTRSPPIQSGIVENNGDAGSGFFTEMVSWDHIPTSTGVDFSNFESDEDINFDALQQTAMLNDEHAELASSASARGERDVRLNIGPQGFDSGDQSNESPWDSTEQPQVVEDQTERSGGCDIEHNLCHLTSTIETPERTLFSTVSDQDIARPIGDRVSIVEEQPTSQTTDSEAMDIDQHDLTESSADEAERETNDEVDEQRQPERSPTTEVYQASSSVVKSVKLENAEDIEASIERMRPLAAPFYEWRYTSGEIVVIED